MEKMKLTKNEMKHVLGGAVNASTCTLVCANVKTVKVTCNCGCRSMTTYVTCTGGEGCNDREDCESTKPAQIAMSVLSLTPVTFVSLK
jgi:hypothetical protein